MRETAGQGKSVAIYGATGFVGTYLTDALLELGYRVVAFAREGSKFCYPIAKKHEARLRLVNPQAASELQRAAEWAGPLTAFFHLAANVNVGEALAAPEAFVSANVAVTLDSYRVLQTHWRETPSVFLSSDRVFGQASGLTEESAPTSPIDPYGLSKALSEDLARYYARVLKSKCVVVRAANIYGPFQRSAQFVPSMFRKIWAGESDIRVGNLSVRRNYLYVGDLVNGLVKVVERLHDVPETVHFGDRLTELQEITAQISRLAAELCGRRVQFQGETAQARPMGSELKDFQLGCRVAHELLAWRPLTGLNQGLENIFLREGEMNGSLRKAN